MEKSDIRILKAIVHILDSTTGTPVLSDSELEFGSDFSDFLREHIWKIMSGDDVKKCRFIQEESKVFDIIKDIDDASFVPASKEVASFLYEIMNSNIDIPPADLILVVYEISQSVYLGILKMNYKTSYTHKTGMGQEGNVNEIITYKTILPKQSQRLSEAALVNLDDMSISLIEKKYEINGTKSNYFSKIFMQCTTSLSQKTKLDIVTKAVEKVQKANYDESEQAQVSMKAKNIIHNEIADQGKIDVPVVIDKIFEDRPELKEEFNQKIEKYNIADEPIKPESETTVKKYYRQFLKTDTGIEIKIPMEEYENKDSVEFITNGDGTVSVLIKNVEKLVSK